MKTYYISTDQGYYGAFASSETAFSEAEEIADAVEENFPNITTTLVPTGYNNYGDDEIREVYRWIDRHWVEILNNVGVY